MDSSKLKLLSPRARLVGAVFAVVSSLSTLAAVLAVFASASGELEPVVAKLKAAPAASEVAKASARPSRG
jgi:hypothetical protein